MTGDITEQHDEPPVRQREGVIRNRRPPGHRRRAGSRPDTSQPGMDGSDAGSRLRCSISATRNAPRGAPVQLLDEVTAERLGGLDLDRRPRFAALVDDLTPALEGFARAEPNPVTFPHRDGLVVRIAAPIHCAQRFVPEPDHVLLIGQIQRECTGGVVQIQVGQFVGQPLGERDFLTGAAGPGGHRGHHFGRWNRSQFVVLAAQADHDAGRGQQIQQAGGAQQRRRDGFALVQRRRGHVGQHRLRGQPLPQLIVVEPVDEPQ